MLIYVKDFNEKTKEKQENDLYLSYQTALLTAGFVANSMNGKKNPDFYELFPDFNKKVVKEQEQKQLDMYKDRFIMYAELHNKNRMKGGK